MYYYGLICNGLKSDVVTSAVRPLRTMWSIIDPTEQGLCCSVRKTTQKQDAVLRWKPLGTTQISRMESCYCISSSGPALSTKLCRKSSTQNMIEKKEVASKGYCITKSPSYPSRKKCFLHDVVIQRSFNVTLMFHNIIRLFNKMYTKTLWKRGKSQKSCCGRVSAAEKSRGHPLRPRARKSKSIVIAMLQSCLCSWQQKYETCVKPLLLLSLGHTAIEVHHAMRRANSLHISPQDECMLVSINCRY